MKILYPDFCGNSPKKILLINIYKAITNYDNIFILNNFADAVHGSALFKDNLQIDFCDVYTFKGFGKNAKIIEIKSYLINLGNHKIL